MSSNNSRISFDRGFTLVELLVIIAMVGVLSTIAIPKISSTITGYRLKAAAREVVVDFKRARAEAVKRNKKILIQFTPATSGGSYLVCVDDNDSDTCDVNDSSLSSVTMPPNVKIASSTFTDNLAGFTSRGLVWNSNSGTVTLQRSGSSGSLVVELSPAGDAHLQ